MLGLYQPLGTTAITAGHQYHDDPGRPNRVLGPLHLDLLTREHGVRLPAAAQQGGPGPDDASWEHGTLVSGNRQASGSKLMGEFTRERGCDPKYPFRAGTSCVQTMKYEFGHISFSSNG
ncbi:hypothetical protein M419DRAFT_7742 [Trichoderma reesei RUT C-30]|uniref:Uncharacterized protein n=1 Tax=Hypocrea jecorina (strain ATCC 56765 / BCRC 32924 / NRRL 11460 / Rut C-30) TaxID=1344414 RepID=A0A024SCD0_HYPJR|nr:hypothetical protein M419DRAFT_7742 [Trichoderma reesei RUT C-30]